MTTSLRDWDINPVSAEEVKTIEGMRKRIQEYARYDSMTRAVMDTAYHRGLSGEDTMTMLAYHALCSREKLFDAALERSYLDMPPLIITKDPTR